MFSSTGSLCKASTAALVSFSFSSLFSSTGSLCKASTAAPELFSFSFLFSSTGSLQSSSSAGAMSFEPAMVHEPLDLHMKSELQANLYWIAAISAPAPAALQPPLVHLVADQVPRQFVGMGYHVMHLHHPSQTPATMTNYCYQYADPLADGELCSGNPRFNVGGCEAG